MYYIIALLTGLCISVMVVMNGQLTGWYGIYSATVLIHVIGLVVIGVAVGLRKERVRHKALPWYFYLGGAIGVATTVFNNLAFGKMSVSALLALGLLGQCLASLAVDQFGLLGMERHPFNWKKLAGLGLVVAGAAVMLGRGGAWIPVVVSLLAGVNLVFSRTLNGGLSQRVGERVSTFYNFAVGLAVALVVILLLGRREPMLVGTSFQLGFFPYFGGAMGVVVVLLSNLAVKRIPAFQMTLLLFVGQVFTGVVLDAVLTGAVSVENMIGGGLVAAGMALHAWLERPAQK